MTLDITDTDDPAGAAAASNVSTLAECRLDQASPGTIVKDRHKRWFTRVGAYWHGPRGYWTDSVAANWIRLSTTPP